MSTRFVIGSVVLSFVGACLAPRSAMAAARRVTMPLAKYVNTVTSSKFFPLKASEGYVVPSSEDRNAFRAAARALAAGDVATAELAIASHPGFEILDLEDGAGGARYFGLVETPPIDRGWGFFFFAQRPLRPQLIIEAPHPLADLNSEIAAARAVSALKPAALLLAGAHRYADTPPPGKDVHPSDVAHALESVFEEVHEALMADDKIALQIHGFSMDAHPEYPDLMLSSGRTEPSPDALAVCTAVTEGGVPCTLYDGTQLGCDTPAGCDGELGAESNVQGRFTRTFGDDHFLHFETAQYLRDDAAHFAVILTAIAERWPAQDVGGGGGCSVVAGRGDSPKLGSTLALALLALLTLARARPFTRSGDPT